jgi:hypothetical protein
MAWVIVREKLASGDSSLRSIATILNNAGFKSSRGKQFSAQTVRQLKDLMEKSNN